MGRENFYYFYIINIRVYLVNNNYLIIITIHSFIIITHHSINATGFCKLF